MWTGTAQELAFVLRGLDPDKTYSLKEFRDTRSKNQNSYFHKLIDLMATAHTLTIGAITATAMKNMMIGRYGQRMRDPDGEALIIKTNTVPEVMMELEEPHTALAKDNGDGTYVYWWYRKTSEYDSREMAALITGTVHDAKALGVETLPPEKLYAMYVKEFEREQKKQSDSDTAES